MRVGMAFIRNANRTLAASTAPTHLIDNPLCQGSHNLQDATEVGAALASKQWRERKKKKLFKLLLLWW